MTRPLINITPAPEVLPFLPAALRARFKGSGYRLRLRAGERRVFRKRPPVKVSAWAESHRVVTMSRYVGRWRNRLTPYSVGIMDASFFKSIETVIVCKSPQTGISEAVNNCIAYAADRAPAPTLYVYPDEQTARENSRDRIQPIFTASPKLRALNTGPDDDLAALRINLKSMPIYMAWAGSAARLANKPIGRLVLDEIDKFPEFASRRETGPIELAEKRTTTFRGDRKIWKISTPTTELGPIWKALTKEAQVIFDYWVTCPKCGVLRLMEFKHIRWPETERDPETIKARDLARYHCPECGDRWDDNRRDFAVRCGSWRARDLSQGRGHCSEPGSHPKSTSSLPLRAQTRGDLSCVPLEVGRSQTSPPGPDLELFDYLEKYRPKKIGFHLPSWISHFVALSEIASAFLKSKDDKGAFRDYKNAFEARPWVVYGSERKEDVILGLRDDRPRYIVPGGGRIIALTAGVDTQDSGFFYEIRAWSGGPTLESWQVDHGFTDTSAGLLEVLFETEYRDLDNNLYIVNLVVHDAMGHRTAEVYDLTRLHRRRHLPYQGARSLTAPYTTSQLEFYPASRGHKKAIPGGLKLVRGNSGYYKDILDTKLTIDAGAPGAWHLNSETTPEYARQMDSEYIDEKGIWQLKPGRANHYWDCAYLNLVAADILRLRVRTTPIGAVRVRNPKKEKPKNPGRSSSRPTKKRRMW